MNSAAKLVVQKVLSLSTQGSDNTNLRDCGYIYWRLLLTDPAAAVVLCEKPLISEETGLLEPSLLEELLCHISSLASVYHKPPSTFVEGRVAGRRTNIKSVVEDSDELLGGLDAPAGAAVGDLLGGLSLGAAAEDGPFALAKGLWLPASKGKGIEILGTFSRRAGQMYMDLTFINRNAEPVGDFAIQFNKNSFALTPAAALFISSVGGSASAEASQQHTFSSAQAAGAQAAPGSRPTRAAPQAAPTAAGSCSASAASAAAAASCSACAAAGAQR